MSKFTTECDNCGNLYDRLVNNHCPECGHDHDGDDDGGATMLVADGGQTVDGTCRAQSCENAATTKLRGTRAGGYTHVCDGHAVSYTACNWEYVEPGTTRDGGAGDA